LTTIIVDDDAGIREGLRAIVETLGVRVLGEAADGRDGIQQAQALLPDLILLDVSMPVMGGFAAALQLRELLPATPIILVSQHSTGVYAEEALKAGVRAYVLKRCAGHDLAAAISAVIGGRIFVSPQIDFRERERYSA
jgi:DNA-binding NarL/FixJ family response regulator